MTSDRFHQVTIALNHVHEMASLYVRQLSDRKAGVNVSARQLSEAFQTPLPDLGCSAATALDDWWSRAEPGVTGSSGPRNFGFVIGGATPAALAADWLTSAIDQNSGLWIASPAAAETDIAALEWLKQLFDLPASWAGSLTSGATHAHMVGLGAARQWAGELLGFDPSTDGLSGQPPIPVLTSTEIHASAVKTLANLGLGRNAARKLPATGGTLNLSSLEATLAETESPVIVIANAGEVNTGAFDDLRRIADLCDQHSHGAWLHVDAAFGLYARLADRTAHLLDGIERADSVCADAHKWLNVPYDSGFAFVRDEAMLRRAFSASAAYLEDLNDVGKDLGVYGPFFSTRFRGLAIWCALRSFGKQGYRDMVNRCLDNASAFGQWLEGNSATELLAPVHLNMVCWRYKLPGQSATDIDLFKREVVGRIQRDGRVFLTPTVWDGNQAIRCAFDNWATSPVDVEILCQAVDDFAPGRQNETSGQELSPELL